MEKVNEDASLEFKWLKKRGVGGKKKEVQFYGSFIYDGVEYELYDCVYMYKEGLREPYIGKLTKTWENAGKAKKVKIHWFFRPEEISNWLGDTKTLENEILFASGEGVGLTNICPLEAIAGKCNVVCVSKDSRNPQPSHDELKAADFIFYRTFDVDSCTLSHHMDAKIGGIEIKDIFNRKEDESISTLPETTSDKMEESETKALPNSLKDDNKQDSKDKDAPILVAKSTLVEKRNSIIDEKADKVEANKRKKTDSLQDQPLKKMKLDNKNPPKEKEVEVEVARESEKLTDMPSKKSKVDNKNPSKEKELKVEGSRESEKMTDMPSKKSKVDNKNPPKEKEVEGKVSRESEKLTDMPSKKSKVDNSTKSHVDHVNNVKASVTAGKNSDLNKNDKADRDNNNKGNKENKRTSMESDELDDVPLKKRMKSPPPNGKQVEVEDEKIEKMTDLPSKKSKDENKLARNVSNLKGLGTSEEKQNIKNDKGKVSDEMEGRILKKTNSIKIPENKKNTLAVNTNGSNGKNLAAKSVIKSPKDMYQEFVISPRPTDDKRNWFRRLPWDESLKNAYDQGTAVLLYNIDPDYTSGEVEDIIYHAFNENCEAKVLPRSAISSPHCYQALVLLKTKDAAQKVLAKLDEDCLMLSNGRPLVATPCPPIIPRKNCKFFGHLVIDRIKITQREEEAVSTSHFSQPNTIEYDMAMEWFLLQSKSKRWWDMTHKLQGSEVKRLEAKLVKK